MSGVWNEFRAFMARGNVIDLAVGVVIGAAFGKIVTTFVDGVIMPPLGLLFGRIDFSSLMIVLDDSKGVPASVADAKAQGIPIIAYGQLLNDIVTFTLIGAAVFVLVKAVNRMRTTPPPPPPSERECPHCATAIPIKARRCPHCTSAVEPAA